MNEYTLKDLLPAIAILGPIIAATITLFVTRRWQKSKQVTFGILESEDLTLPLKNNAQMVIIEIQGYRGFELNRGIVTVQNTGQAAVKDFNCHIVVPGEHSFASAQIGTAERKLLEAIKIERSALGSQTFNPEFNISAPFFNPAEGFSILVFFDKSAVECEVSCRIEDVRVRVKRGDALVGVAGIVGKAVIRGALGGLLRLS